ncbi:MAG: DsbA family protein [Candidatus Nanohaloarchaeota archaeon QJJ-5]|nr:DsbA family protein [Candidatus Nanohaloarchaeota archaeon QJJ-5]
MTDCEYCDETFDEEQALHLHWLDEHEDELNSHQKDEAKESKKQYEKEQERKQAKRSQSIKQIVLYGGIGVLLLAVIGLIGYQLDLDQSTPGGSLENVSLEGRQYLGDANASVTVVKFSDFQCHYCDQFNSQIFPQLKSEFIDAGDVKYYHLHYPALGPASETSAIASECIASQNESVFWDYKDDLFEQQSQLGEEGTQTSFYTDLASGYDSINQTTLRSCINSQQTRDVIQGDVSRGNEVGVSGTPHIMVGDTRIEQWTNFDNIRDAIESKQ